MKECATRRILRSEERHTGRRILLLVQLRVIVWEAFHNCCPCYIYGIFNTHLGHPPKGRAMGILAYRKQHKVLNSAVQTMRSHGIAVSGPYRRQNGTLIFSVADDVVTEDELLRLP